MNNETVAYNNFCMNGLILPTSIEKNWSTSLRAFLYLIALLYSFVGIAIIADVFMCAIERITSTTKRVKIVVQDGETAKRIVQYKDVLVWNPTVANLSLMSFGSSAPEILLSIIEMMGNNFKVGEIGPGSIVGSAAFNLMVINAICIASIPKGEKKGIEKISVYCVTAFWNVFAYLWLLFILLGSSKDEIEVWEGTMTFLFFFLLILSAYVFDKELYKVCFKKRMKPKIAPVEIITVPQIVRNDDIEIVITDTDAAENSDPTSITFHPEWREFERQASMDFPNAQEEELAKVIALKINAQRPKDYLEHRIDAIRKLSKSSMKDSFSDASDRGSEKKGLVKASKLEFSSRVYGIDPDTDSKVQLKVVRRGGIRGRQATIKYETANGGAKENVHFIPKSGTLEFDFNENEKIITVDLVEGARWSKGDLFTVRLEPESSVRQEKAKLGKCSTAEVIFVGAEYSTNSSLVEVEFVKHSINVKFNDGYIRVPVVRKGGIKEKISVDWVTEGITVKQGSNFESTTGNVTLEEGEIETYFDIPIVDRALVEKNKMFLVRLTNPSTNASIGQTSVTMINNDGLVRVFNKIDTLVPKILRSLEPGKQSWQEQFYQYLNVNGGDTMYASMSDYIGHVISFPWKVICSLVPPPIYFGGWITFILSLGLIGLVTAFVLDLAGTFGCLVGLDNTITAITFVALGTSLPDTFASRIAAIQDRTADNAVGNVTGSNSVNVFVGMGLPWFIASIYWRVKGEKFHVYSGDVGFCVTIYAVCAILTISLILARRYLRCLGQAELGGPSKTKWACSIVLVLLWLFYVVISSLQVYGHLNVHF